MSMLLSLVLTAALSAGEAESPIVEEQISKMVLMRNVRNDIETYQKLKDRYPGLEGFPKSDKLLSDLSAETGEKNLTYDRLVELTTPPRGMWQSVTGFFTLINIIWITAAIFMVVAIVMLCGHYLAEILMRITAEQYEALAYMACFGAIMGGWLLPERYGLWLAFPGCLGIMGAFTLTHFLHYNKRQNRKSWDESMELNVYHWLAAIIWGVTAIVFASQLIGFISTMALMAALGFVAFMHPGCIYMGFKNDTVIVRATIGALGLLLIHVISTISGRHFLYYDVFSLGFSFIGTWVYFLGILIVSSKLYSGTGAWHDDGGRSTGDNYLPLQFVTVLSGIAALYLGTTYGMGQLLSIGGTFFYVYLIEKYLEIPWKGIGWAWALLGLSGILYGLALFANEHPQYFLFMG